MAANRQKTKLLPLDDSNIMGMIASYFDESSFSECALVSKQMRKNILCSPLPTGGKDKTPTSPKVLAIAKKLNIKFEMIATKVRHFRKHLSIDDGQEQELEWQMECLSGSLTSATIDRIIAMYKKESKPLFDVLHAKKVLFFIILSDSAAALKYLEIHLNLLEEKPFNALWALYWSEQTGFLPTPLAIAFKYEMHSIRKHIIQHETLSGDLFPVMNDSSPDGYTAAKDTLSYRQLQAILDYAFEKNFMYIVGDVIDKLTSFSLRCQAVALVVKHFSKETSFQNILYIWQKLEDRLIKTNSNVKDFENIVFNLLRCIGWRYSHSPQFTIFMITIIGNDSSAYLSGYDDEHGNYKMMNYFVRIIKDNNLTEAESSRQIQDILVPTESYIGLKSHPAVTTHIAVLDAAKKKQQLDARKKFSNSLAKTIRVCLLLGVGLGIAFSPLCPVALPAGIAISIGLTIIGGVFAALFSALSTISAYKNMCEEYKYTPRALFKEEPAPRHDQNTSHIYSRIKHNNIVTPTPSSVPPSSVPVYGSSHSRRQSRDLWSVPSQESKYSSTSEEEKVGLLTPTRSS